MRHSSEHCVYHRRMTEPATSSAIQVVDYDPDRPRTFLRLRDWIWPSVSDVALAIEQVGSTAVPGMAAKPVMDMDVVIASRTNLPSIVSHLGSLGSRIALRSRTT